MIFVERMFGIKFDHEIRRKGTKLLEEGNYNGICCACAACWFASETIDNYIDNYVNNVVESTPGEDHYKGMLIDAAEREIGWFLHEAYGLAEAIRKNYFTEEMVREVYFDALDLLR